MKFHTTISVYLLALLMTAQAFVTPLVYLDFKLRQDYIAKVFCVNQDKPQLQCNGQCYLMKKIRKSEQKKQAQDNHTQQKKTFEIFCESLFCFNTDCTFALERIQISFQPSFFPRYFSDIFRPPKIAALC